MSSRLKSMIRDSFVREFGEDQAVAIEGAAIQHGNGINNINTGSDLFRWAILICIGYQCAEVDSYRQSHGITAPWEKIKTWIKINAHLESHDGDCDYLALFACAYNEYMPEESDATV